MKIIGRGASEELLVQISPTELEKLLGSYYAHEIPGIKKKVSQLNPGDYINVNLLHDMTSSLVSAAKEMRDTVKAFEKSQETMMAFAEIVLASPK